MNKGCFWGRLSKDPDDLVMRGEMAKGRIYVAVQRRKKNDDGTYTADFIPVTTWGKVAENCHKYLTKGRPVAVEYHLQSGSYDGQDGKRHFTLDVVADNVDFLPAAKSDNQGAQTAAAPTTAQASAAPPSGDDGFTVVETEELPF